MTATADRFGPPPTPAYPPTGTSAHPPTGGDGLDAVTVVARREERLVRLLERASASSRFNLGERWLFALGGALVVAGFVAVIIGWVGASQTVLVAGQIPYLISGGLIGLGLIFVGAFLYFGHWLAVLVRESRERGVEDREDLALVRRSLEDVSRNLQQVAVALAPPACGRAPAAGRAPAEGGPVPAVGRPVPDFPVGLVATPTGGMSHLPTCRAIAGRAGLRPVSPEEDLRRCGLCQPDPRGGR